ncbi:hypothetical protein ACHAWU_000637 [Discostella pseudostelligera]|uniref:Rieske domain-containing protein n=1 Tax=Discostella pseudostelligera TaxID=259834 RepID=A0ABD3MH19_9STRA
MAIWLYLLFTMFLIDTVNSFVHVHVRLGPPPSDVLSQPLSNHQIQSDTSAFIESSDEQSIDSSLGAWMPLGSASALTGLGPTQIRGRVDPESGCIECPYHGWSFDKDGSLHTIPQLDEGRTIKTATGGYGGATSLPVHAAGDLLFVFLPTEITGESWPKSRLPEHHYSNLQDQMDKGATYFARDVP